MLIAQIGNFGPPHSTENHLNQALRWLGHTVLQIQEEDGRGWDHLRRFPSGYGLVLWTRTASLSAQVGDSVKAGTIDALRTAGVPIVGFHLDRWWGLRRAAEVTKDIYFRGVDLLITADGGHEKEWIDAGVRHEWMAPAVSHLECLPGEFKGELFSPVAFVGSWQGHYHDEWPHRRELVEWLATTYGDLCQFWPRRGEPAVRGDDLRHLYASAQVLVGDSCLVPNADGSPASHYWSDRIPETLGRGGLLVHPRVEGMGTAGFYDKDTLLTWELGNWDELAAKIDWALAGRGRHMRTNEANAIACRGRAEVLRSHTYLERMRQLGLLLDAHQLLDNDEWTECA